MIALLILISLGCAMAITINYILLQQPSLCNHYISLHAKPPFYFKSVHCLSTKTRRYIQYNNTYLIRQVSCLFRIVCVPITDFFGNQAQMHLYQNNALPVYLLFYTLPDIHSKYRHTPSQSYANLANCILPKRHIG